MSNQHRAFGLDADLQAKKDSKYNPELEAQAIDWIAELTGERSPGVKDEFYEFLKDGQVLCALINAIKPGSVKKVNTSKMAFKQMENINNFLSASTSALGVPVTDLFQTVDLYENKNMVQVVGGIHAVGRHAAKDGFSGPTIGVKLATANAREFDEATLNAGKAISSQQMGNNKGASQAGMTAAGARREVDHMSHNKI
eukprot:Awhi_evm1s6013